MKYTVVIPTVGRESLAAALESALNQSSSPNEVLIVADTNEPIHVKSDSKIRVLRVGPNAGANVARQFGILEAKSEVIALLDDDDVWHLDKMKTQLELAEIASQLSQSWLVTCPVVADQPGGKSEIWPNVLYKKGQNLTDYIFQKKSIIGGQGFIQASSLVFPRAVAMKTPFDQNLRFHEDVDWVIKLSKSDPNFSLHQSKTPLLIYKVRKGSVSQGIDASDSAQWGRVALSNESPRTLGDFFLTVPSIYARRQGHPLQSMSLFKEGFEKGKPGWPATIFALAGVLLAFQKWVSNKFEYFKRE